MIKCPNCPVKDGRCIAETAGWEFMCGTAERGNPVEILHIVNRSAMGEATVEYPPLGIWQKLKNLTGAVATQVMAGNPKASPEVQAERKAICQVCEHLRGNTCQLCGCGLDLKRSWATSSCPDKRWSAVEPETSQGELEQGVDLSTPPVESPA